MTRPALTNEDLQRLKAINDAQDTYARTSLIHIYYRDLSRANRTPRDVIYGHIGLLTAMIGKLYIKRSWPGSDMIPDPLGSDRARRQRDDRSTDQ